MSTLNQDELKAIKVLKFTGKESECDHWSEKFIALARASGFAGILLGTDQAPYADKEIDRNKMQTEKKRKDSVKQMAMHTSTSSCHVRS